MGEAAAVQNKTSLNLSSTRQPLRGPLSGSSPRPPGTPAPIFSHFALDKNARSSRGLRQVLMKPCCTCALISQALSSLVTSHCLSLTTQLGIFSGFSRHPLVPALVSLLEKAC